jgi:hypothetical protein
LINYFRFLYRLLDKINITASEVSQTSIKGQLEKISRALTDRVVEIFKKHMTSVSDRSNQFSLRSHQWITFAYSEKWQMYEFVIGKYKEKYNGLLKRASFTQGQW